jgi:TolA-binding protein
MAGSFARLLGIGLLGAAAAAGCQGVGAWGDKPPDAGDSLAKLQEKNAADAKNPDGVVRASATTDDKGLFAEISDSFHQWDLSYRHWNWFGLAKEEETPPPPATTFVLRGDGIEEAKAPLPGTAAARLAGAHELLRQGQYARAETIFHRLAENEKNPAKLVQEARYYEAECLRLQKRYPEAADTYADLMNKFPNNPYREQAVQHMYTIANYWLEDTRQRMRDEQEVRDGKRWFAWNQIFHPFDETKPVFDEEGRAVELLEKVQLNGLDGPLADKSLFLCGAVRYYDNDFAEADYYFSQIHERHPNSPLAPQAVELGIVAKNLSTGGSDYDGRKSAEARILVNAALNNYPELAGDPQKQEDLIKQLKNITYQQAEKDYKMAEFWAWTGHPGSAYFYFELVRRRYPGTKFAEMATVRRDQLREAAEKEEAKKPGKIAPPISGNPPAGTAPAPQKPLPGEIAPPPVLPPDIRR